MKRKHIIPVISMLCVLLLAACSGKKSETEAYLKVLPDNSLAIVKMDLGNILDESEILGNTFIKGAAGIGIGSLPENMRPLLQNIYDNPAASGININAPMYLAVANVDPISMVITMDMDNMEAFENAMLTFGMGEIEVIEQDGMKHVVTGDDEVACAYDSDKLIVVVDDIDLPRGDIRYRQHGSAGTHNGLRSIVSYIGQDFERNSLKVMMTRLRFMIWVLWVRNLFAAER